MSDQTNETQDSARRRLLRSIAQLNAGEGVEHELIETDDEILKAHREHEEQLDED